MTPQPTDDEMTAMRQFKQQIKDWLAQNNFTQKELSLKLGVTYGAVRNWFSSDSNISETNRLRIQALMDNPAAFKKQQEETVYLVTLRITPYTANMPMWRSSAQVKDVNFRRDVAMGSEAVEFAKWSTAIINGAIRDELKKHKPEELKAKAKLVHIGNDPFSILEGGNGYRPLTEEEQRRENEGIPIQLPILANRINFLYLAIAALCAGTEEDDFIADALNAAADSDFGAALDEFLNQEEEAVGDILVPHPKDDDDCPF